MESILSGSVHRDLQMTLALGSLCLESMFCVLAVLLRLWRTPATLGAQNEFGLGR